VKLKLTKCAPGGRPRRALFCAMARRHQDSASRKGALAHDPGPCSPLEIRCYFRRLAAQVFVFAREMSRACRFRCSLQDPHLILQANFGASG
jgi:hypothetical protein